MDCSAVLHSTHCEMLFGLQPKCRHQYFSVAVVLTGSFSLFGKVALKIFVVLSDADRMSTVGGYAYHRMCGVRLCVIRTVPSIDVLYIHCVL